MKRNPKFEEGRMSKRENLQIRRNERVEQNKIEENKIESNRSRE